MLSYRSDVMAFWCHAVCIMLTTTFTASSVKCCGLLPIQSLGSKPCSSAVVVICQLTTVLITLPRVFRSNIGLQAPAVCCYQIVFPGFCSTATLAVLNQVRKCSSCRLVVAIQARRAVSGGLHAFRKPIGRRSMLGAFYRLVLCRILTTLFCVIS